MFSSHFSKARCLLALPLMCWALSSHAQSRISADEAVALALAQPHVPLALDADMALARSELQAARTRPNPALALSQERGNLGPLGDTRDTSAMLTQEFEFGGRRGLRRQAAEQGVAAAELGAAHQRARIRADVLRAYSEAVSGELRWQAHVRTAESLRGLGTIAANRQRGGDLSGYESGRIAQAAAQAQARAAQADADARTARARLAAFIGDVAMDARLDDQPPLPRVPPPVEGLPSLELEVLDARRRQAEAAAQAERRFAVPVTVGVGTKRIEEFGARDSQVLLEIGVPLPLFDRNQAARTRTAAEADQAEANYQHALLATRSRRGAARDATHLLSTSARELLDTAVPEARRLTGVARASYAEGELDLVGLLDAHDAEADVLEQALGQQSRALDALLELQLLSPPIHANAPPNR